MSHEHKSKAELIIELQELQQAYHLLKEKTEMGLPNQKQTEAAVKAGEERFELLFNKAPLGYQSLDFDGYFIEVNQQWLDTLGYEREEVIGKWFGDFLTPAFQEGFRKRFPIFKEQGKIHSEFEMVHKNGTVLFIAFDGRIGYDNKGDFMQTHCILQDITSQKQAEKELLKSQMLLHAMEKAAKIGGWEFDVETMVQTWTDEVFHILEIDTTLGAPDVPSGIGFIAPEYQPMALLGIQRAIEFGEPYNQEWEVITAKGNKRWINAIATPHLENGKTKFVSGSFQDITDRRQAETALRESEENLSTTLHSIGDGVISTDVDGLVVQMNPVAEKLCGWPLAEAKGKPLTEVFKIINAETRQTVADPVKIVLEKGEIVGLANHTVLVSQNGTEYQISDSAAPIRNKKGDITGVVLVFSDVTAMYETQKQIKESEERFRSLLGNLEAGIVVHAADTSIVLNNGRAAELLGLTDDQMKGKVAIDPAWKFVHEDNRAFTLDEYPVNRIVKSKKPLRNQILGIQHPGKNNIVWVTVNGFPVLDAKGGIAEIVISFIDITERKLADESLKLSNERYRFALEVTGQIGWSTPPDGVVEDMPMWRQYSGQSLEEVVGWKWLDAVHSDDRDSAFKAWSTAAAEKCNYFTEYRIRRADGVYRNFMVRGIPLLNADGSCKEWVGTCIDITERKQAEHLLQEKTIEIEAQNEEYQQINEELNQTNQELIFAKERAEESERLLSKIAENYPNSFISVIEKDLTVGFSGGQEFKRQNLNPNDFVGLTLEQVFGEFTPIVRENYLKTFDGQETSFELFINNQYQLYKTVPLFDEKNQITRILSVVENITERKQIEKALTLTRISIDSASDSLYWMKPDGTIVDVNEAACRLLGYTREEILHLSVSDVDAHHNAEVWAQHFPKLRKHCTLKFESEQRAKDGRLIPVEIVANYIRQGDEEYNCAFVRDITERKRLEGVHAFLSTSGYSGSDKTFFESLAKYLAEILDSEYVCIDKLEGDGLTAQTIAIYNEGKFEPNVSYTLKQTPCGDVVGKNICCFPENVCQLFPHDQALQELKAHSYIGTTLWSFDGKPIGLIAIIGQKPLKNAAFAENVLKLVAIRAAGELERIQTGDGLKMAKLKAEESEAFFRSIFENSPVGKSITGIDGSLKTNKSFSDMLGYTFEEFQTKNLTDITHPDDIQKTKEVIEALLTGKESVIRFEKKHIHKNGSVVFSEVVTTLQKNRDGKPLFFITSVQDITERKQSEKVLKESEERFKNMFERHSSIMLLIEPESGRIIGANEASASFYGYSKSKLLTMRIDEINTLSPEQVKMERELAVHEERTYFVFPHKLASGEVRTVEVHSSPIVFQDQKILFSIIHDITERKKAEEVSKKEQALSNAIIESIPGTFYMLDETGQYVRWNAYQRDEIVGKPDELVGRTNALDTIHPNDRDLIQSKIANVLANGVVENVESRVLLRGGPASRWLVMTGSRMLIDGHPFLVGIGIDITERKLAEEKLKESELKYRSLIENTSDAIFCVDEKGEYKFTNNLFASTFGKSPDDFVGKTFWDIYDKQHADYRYETVKRVFLTGKSENIEVEVPLPDKTLYFLASSNPIKDETGKVILNLTHATDITKIKMAEHELQLAKEIADVNTANITAIIEGTADSIWAFNKQFEIVYINQVFKREFYQTFGIWLEPGTSIVNSLPEAIRPFWKQRYDRVLNNEQFTVEDAVDTGNGFLYIQVTFNPIIKKGQVIGGSCFGSNITSRKLAEIELIKAKAQAEESDRLKSAFLANMSHEIRTPMNGILGFAEILKDPELSGDQQQEYIKIIEKSGNRMLNIINDIVDISKIEAGLMKLDIRDSNINEQIEYIYTFFKPEVEAKGMKLSFKTILSAREATILTDREKVYAILTNLVKNAIKYSKQGSIELGYKIVETQCIASLQFYVKDTGIGIPRNRQEAIFERFIQADITDKMARQGAGLGLAITKSYVEMLGGKIWVESQEGEGSTFYFTLPYNYKAESDGFAQSSVSSTEKYNWAKKLKILIAEDDQTSEMLISIMVNTFGREILRVVTGTDAVESCRNNPDIDLILMDIQMPVMGGYEATRQIRGFNKNVVIIAQTAYGLSGDREKAIEAGCNDYVSKPINKIDLLALIQKYFGK